MSLSELISFGLGSPASIEAQLLFGLDLHVPPVVINAVHVTGFSSAGRGFAGVAQTGRSMQSLTQQARHMTTAGQSGAAFQGVTSAGLQFSGIEQA